MESIDRGIANTSKAQYQLNHSARQFYEGIHQCTETVISIDYMHVKEIEGFNYETFDKYHSVTRNNFSNDTYFRSMSTRASGNELNSKNATHRQLCNTSWLLNKSPIEIKSNNVAGTIYKCTQENESDETETHSKLRVGGRSNGSGGNAFYNSHPMEERRGLTKSLTWATNATPINQQGFSHDKNPIHCTLCNVAKEMNWNVIIAHDHSMIFKCKTCFFSTTISHTFKNHVKNQHGILETKLRSRNKVIPFESRKATSSITYRKRRVRDEWKRKPGTYRKRFNASARK